MQENNKLRGKPLTLLNLRRKTSACNEIIFVGTYFDRNNNTSAN